MFLKRAERRDAGGAQEQRFERTILPHLDAAYNLARWITQNEHDAEDVVQEAALRALRFLDGFRGGDARAWFLTIVRNTGYTWLRRNRPPERDGGSLDEERPGAPLPGEEGAETNPETLLLQRVDAAAVRCALERLPIEFREVIVLREMEGFSYREIADVAGVPIGTVMSRLARARKRLQESLAGLAKGEGAAHGL